MSFSSSTSGSFSSSYALVQHFDELAGVLADRGFSIADHAWRTIEQCIEDEALGWVAFYGIDRMGIGQACARIVIDWTQHQIIIESGDRVRLPVDSDGAAILRRVRRIGHHFMDFFDSRVLEPSIRCQYRDELMGQSDALNIKYGWSPAPPIQRAKGATDAIDWESDYHKGVIVDQYYGA